MRKNKENYLDFIPKHNSLYPFMTNQKGHIEIRVKNTGLFNRIAQFLFRRPKFSNIELDDFGSFVWECINGESTIYEIGVLVKKEFEEKAEPLYPRLSQFIKTLRDNSFVIYMNKIKKK